MTVNSIKIKNLKIIKNKKGDIIKFLKKKDNLFKGFGEIYFSEIYSNQQKGWNFHKKNTCLISVPFGNVNFKIFNPEKKIMTSIAINKKNQKIIQIPPGNWFMFYSKTKKSLVVNLMNKPHLKSETVKSNEVNGIMIK